MAQAAGQLRDGLQRDCPDVLTKVAAALYQEDGEQTSLMAILDSLSLLREQWCSEPSVHGDKSTHPQG